MGSGADALARIEGTRLRYDAVAAVGLAKCAALARGEDSVGDLHARLRNTTFAGVSGSVAFDGYGSRASPNIVIQNIKGNGSENYVVTTARISGGLKTSMNASVEYHDGTGTFPVVNDRVATGVSRRASRKPHPKATGLRRGRDLQ